MTSDDRLFPAGTSAAPTPSAMIARPATRIPRARERAEKLPSPRVAMIQSSTSPTSGNRNWFLSAGQHLLHSARCLAQALFVFDQRNPHETFALLAEPDARSDRDVGFGQ